MKYKDLPIGEIFNFFADKENHPNNRYLKLKNQTVQIAPVGKETVWGNDFSDNEVLVYNKIDINQTKELVAKLRKSHDINVLIELYRLIERANEIKEQTFSELKIGDKFRLISNANSEIWMKIKQDGSYNVVGLSGRSIGLLGWIGDDDPVRKQDVLS